MTAVTNWLEGEQGSELEKALEVNKKWNLYTAFIEGIFTQLTSVYVVVVPKCRCYLAKRNFVENLSLKNRSSAAAPSSPFAAANCPSEQVRVGFL